MERIGEELVLACLDVHYRDDRAVGACVLFDRWTDAEGGDAFVERFAGVAEYEPGRFYVRELPCLVHLLGKVPRSLEAVIIDGYVWLGGEDQPGLGAYLYREMGQEIPVVGVAKSRFKRGMGAVEVYRGRSRRPLYVTAVGMDPETAADHIRDMHGHFRIPTLLKEADRLCRALPQGTA